MNRRELAKKGAAGFCGLALPPIEEGDATTPLTQPQGGMGGMGRMGFPDKIVSSFQFRDKIIVACEHSVWEMWQDHTGQFVKALVSQF